MPLRARQAEWAAARMAAVRWLADALVRRGARHVILFGSLATGQAVGPDSDVDLAVVMPGVEGIRFHRRLADVPEVAAFPYALDIAVYSPGEWEAVQGHSFVRHEILERGVVLH